jgi:hypothetical protein
MYSNKQTPIKKMAPAKPYCKVCADSKKPESVITSHNVRDPKTNVVLCPTLLSQKCNYCGQNGHTTSHCKSKQKDARVEERETKLAKTKAQTDTSKFRKTGFAALESDSEDEDDDKVVVEDYPQVSLYTHSLTKPALVGYAAALQKEPAPPAKIYTMETFPMFPKPTKKLDWATAESDSEGDEEEE